MSFISIGPYSGNYTLKKFNKIKSGKATKIKGSWDLQYVETFDSSTSSTDIPTLHGFFSINRRNKFIFFLDDGDGKFRKRNDLKLYTQRLNSDHLDFLLSAKKGSLSVGYSEIAFVDDNGNLDTMQRLYDALLFNSNERDLSFQVDLDLADKLSQLLTDLRVPSENTSPQLEASYQLVAEVSPLAGEILIDINDIVTGSDFDVDNQSITYSITSGNEDNIVEINADTGFVSFDETSSLSSLGSRNISIVASDGITNTTSSLDIEFLTSLGQFLDPIPENTDSGTVIIDSKDYLPLNLLNQQDPIRYSIVSGDFRNALAIDADTGLISVASLNSEGNFQPQFLDAESDACIDLKISASDRTNIVSSRLQFVVDEAKFAPVLAVGDEISPDNSTIPNHGSSDLIQFNSNFNQFEGDPIAAYLDAGRTVQFGITNNGTLGREDVRIVEIRNDVMNLALEPNSDFVTFTAPYSGKYYLYMLSTEPGSVEIGVSGDGSPHQGFQEQIFCDFIV